jgi:hypothetical protein
MKNEVGFADHLRTSICIPRKIKLAPGIGVEGRNHGPDLTALYGPDGKLMVVFDSAREIDLVVPDGELPVSSWDGSVSV